MAGLSSKRSRQIDGPGSDSSTEKRVKLESYGHLENGNVPMFTANPEATADTGPESAAPKTEPHELSRVLQQGDMPSLSNDPKSIDALKSEPVAAKMENESSGLLEAGGVPLLHRAAESNGVLGSKLPAAKVEEPEPSSRPKRAEFAVMDATEGFALIAPQSENLERDNETKRSTTPVAEKATPWYRYILGAKLLARQREQLEPGNTPALDDVHELRTVAQRGDGRGSRAMPEPGQPPKPSPSQPPEPSQSPQPEMLPLSEEALERLKQQPLPRAPRPEGPKPTDIARFARNGGPNLRLIRADVQTPPQPLVRGGRRNWAFSEEHIDPVLFCSRIYPIGYNFPLGPVPVGLDKDREKLLDPTASFSGQDLATAADFEHFKLENTPPDGRPVVLANIARILTGYGKPACRRGGGVAFTNMTPLGRTSVPAPDYYDTVGPMELDQWALRALSWEIAPTADQTMPVAPNFFLEVRDADGKGRDGETAARTRSYLDGAYGARAMHALYNFGRPERICDERARTFTATFEAGTGLLEIYCHHVVELPRDRGDKEGVLEFHTTFLWGLTLTASLNAFVMGVGIFRNVREMARRKRTQLVNEANVRALHVYAARNGQVGRPVGEDRV